MRDYTARTATASTGPAGTPSNRQDATCDQLLVGVREAARRLCIGRSLAYRLVQTGQLRSLKVAGARRIAVADLAEYVERLRAAASEELDA